MAPPPPAEPSRYLAPTLTSELDYFPGKPTVKFLCDDSGYACIPHRGYLLRDPLSQAHLALQHFQAALESPITPMPTTRAFWPPGSYSGKAWGWPGRALLANLLPQVREHAVAPFMRAALPCAAPPATALP